MHGQQNIKKNKGAYCCDLVKL